MIIYVDIDGTICSQETSKEYNLAEPDYCRIDKINKLHDEGHTIHYWTARGANSHLDWRQFTQRQLDEWEVKYDSIMFNKPHYDIWIDDKAQNDKHYFERIKNTA